jgi:hypothetical protein
MHFNGMKVLFIAVFGTQIARTPGAQGIAGNKKQTKGSGGQ